MSTDITSSTALDSVPSGPVIPQRSARHMQLFNALFDYLPDALIDMIHGYSQDLCAFAVGGRIGPLFSSQVTYLPVDISQYNTPKLNAAHCSAAAAASATSSSPSLPPLTASPPLSLPDGMSLSSSDGVWRVLPPLHLVRVGCSAICYGNRLYALGGRSTEGISASCEVFDFRRPLIGWEFIADLNIARMNCASTVYEEVRGIGCGKIILAGGLSHRGPEQSCEIYDIEAGKWLVHLIPVMNHTQVDQLQVDHNTGNLVAVGRSLSDGEISVETFPLQRLQQNSRRLTRSSRLRAFSNTAPVAVEFGELQWTLIDRISHIRSSDKKPDTIPNCLRIYTVAVPICVDDDGRDGKTNEEEVCDEVQAEKDGSVNFESKEENPADLAPKKTKKKVVPRAEVLVEWHDEKFCLRSSTRGHSVAMDYEAHDYVQVSITGTSASQTQGTNTSQDSSREVLASASASTSASTSAPASASPSLKAGPPPSQACLYERDCLGATVTNSWSLPSLPNGRLFCGTALGAVELWE